MPKLKTVIFDADGTLFDSIQMIHAAYCHIAQTHSLPEPTEEQVRAELGKPIREIIMALFPGNDTEVLFETNQAYAATNYLDVLAHEGLVAVLEHIKQRDLKLAILTSGSDSIHRILQHHEIDAYFVSVVHSERVSKHKPDPEGFLLAAEECGCEPAEAVMVGDMAVDVEAGKRANALAAIGITHGFGSRESLEQAGADYIIDSLAELPAVLDKIDHQ